MTNNPTIDGVSHPNVCASIQALLDLDARGSLAPHGIGGLARDVLTQAKTTIAQLQARVAELESARGEPVAWVNGEQLKLCAASPREVEPDNPLVHNLPRNIAGSALKTSYCNTPLFTAPPAPVAAVPILWEIRVPDEPQNPESPAEYLYAQGVANRDLLLLREGATVVAEYACLDVAAALNEVRK